LWADGNTDFRHIANALTLYASFSNILSVEVSRDLLNTIADNIEAGDRCFIHKVTHEIIAFPDDYLLDIDPENNAWQEDIEKVESDDSYIQIEKMSSNKYFDTMEAFANSVGERSVKIRLLTALDGRKPFANFKHQIDSSGEWRELWFEFRRQKNVEWIAKQLKDIR